METPEGNLEGEELIPFTAETLPLSSEVIQQSISLIARTASGTSHAYTRLEIHDSQITSVAEIKNFPHLRYIVSFFMFSWKSIKSASLGYFYYG